MATGLIAIDNCLLASPAAVDPATWPRCGPRPSVPLALTRPQEPFDHAELQLLDDAAIIDFYIQFWWSNSGLLGKR